MYNKRVVIGLPARPITFTRELQNQVSTEGKNAVFTCELSKPGAPVEWRKGRVILKPGDKYQMRLEGRLTKLVINNLVEADAGSYTCKSKDSLSTAELTVQGKIRSGAAGIGNFVMCCVLCTFHCHVTFLLVYPICSFHLECPLPPQPQ